MNLFKYIKDKMLMISAWFLSMLFLIFFLWITPNYPFDWGTVLYLCFLLTLIVSFFFCIDYFLKQRWWSQFNLQKNDLILQRKFVNPRTEEEKISQQYIHLLLTEHRVFMQEILEKQSEQKDYLDSWVHEIKVPLAASQLLLRAIEFDISDEKYNALDNELNKMNDYVEQVLYVARLENFTQDYFIKETSLLATIQPIIKSFANYFIEKRLRLVVENKDTHVLTDRKWVAFIFRQLLSNAIKYTPENGVVTIAIKTTEKGTFLSISDTGVGILESEQQRIFDKGFTGSNGRNEEVHSTGLGLYLAKNLAEQLGIELSVSSIINKGTTMTLFFPVLSFYQTER